jgi:hypothetical protein
MPPKVAILGDRAWPDDRRRPVEDAARFVERGTVIVTFDQKGVCRLVRDAALEAGHVLAVLCAPWDAVGFQARNLRDAALLEIADRVIVYRSGSDPAVDRLVTTLRKVGKEVDVRG